MSTYNPYPKNLSEIEKSNNPSAVLFRTKRDKTIKELTTWFLDKKWFCNDSISYEVIISGKKSNELAFLIHSSHLKIEEVVSEVSKTNFEKIGLDIKFSSFEKASWNNNTYFINLIYLG